MDKKNLAIAAISFAAGMGALFAAQKTIASLKPEPEKTPATETAAAPEPETKPPAEPPPRAQRRRPRRPRPQSPEGIATQQLAAAEAPAPEGAAAEARPQRRRGRGMHGFGFMRSLNELKESDPEAYTQATNAAARFMQRANAAAENRMRFLSDIDPESMSPEALKVHNRLREILELDAKAREELMDSATTDERREELMVEMMARGGEARELNRLERQNLLLQMSEKLGYSGDNAQTIVETVEEIYRNTSGGMGGMGGPRGGPPQQPPPAAR